MNIKRENTDKWRYESAQKPKNPRPIKSLTNLIATLVIIAIFIIFYVPAILDLVFGSQYVHAKGDEIFPQFSASTYCVEVGPRQYVNQSIDIAPYALTSFDCNSLPVTDFLNLLHEDSSISDLKSRKTEFYSGIRYKSMGCSVKLDRTSMERTSDYAKRPVNRVDLTVSYCKE